MLGITEEYKHFDADLIMHINSVFMVLNQIGVGPTKCFFIEDELPIWDDFLDDPTQLPIVKSYMQAKVRLLFDPPASSSHMTAITNAISEFEFRLNVAVDNGGITGNNAVLNTSDSIVLTDRTTDNTYELYVDNGELVMTEQEE